MLPTPLAWLGLRVRELLYPVQPAIQAYADPARTIDATRTYRGGLDSGDSDDNKKGLFQR